MPLPSSLSDKAPSVALKEERCDEDPGREALGQQNPPVAEAAPRLKYLKWETEHVFVPLPHILDVWFFNGLPHFRYHYINRGLHIFYSAYYLQ